MGFVFMGPKDQPRETVTCLVVREAIATMTMATAVPSKSVDQFVVRRALAFLAEVGRLRRGAIVKSDQESSTTSIVARTGG